MATDSLAVHVAEIGIITGFGSGPAALWQGLVCGEHRFVPRPELGQSAIAAAVPDDLLPADLDRSLGLCEVALRPIETALKQVDLDRRRLGVCVASTQGAIRRWEAEQRRADEADFKPHPPHTSDPLYYIANRLNAGGPLCNPSVACASGTSAIGIGLDWIRTARCDATVVGGVDALSRFVYQGFRALRALAPDPPRPFDAERRGLGLGEAAALLLLRRGGGACSVDGWGLRADANHLTGPDPTGSGVARAITAALDDADCSAASVDFVSAHGTGTLYNDLMEAKGLRGAFGTHLSHIAVNSIKGAVGHSLAAAGAVEAVACYLVLDRQQIPPTTGLRQQDQEIAPLRLVREQPLSLRCRRIVSCSSGFAGVNAAVVLSGS